jgi:hypothetical protein
LLASTTTKPPCDFLPSGLAHRVAMRIGISEQT